MSLVPIKDKLEMADRLAVADLLPSAYRRKPANVLVAIEYGDALGMPPIVAMNMIHVIEGKPTLSAQAIGGLVRKAGHKLRVHWDGTKMRATAEIIRADDPDFTFTATWDMDRARSAGLTGKGVWKQYPDAMLKARAITEVARDACPEALFGVAYTAEELGEDTLDPTEVSVTTAPVVDDVRPRFVEACENAGLNPDDVIAEAGVEDITAETLPALRDAFKRLKEQPPVVEAEVVDAEPEPEPAPKPARLKPKAKADPVEAAAEDVSGPVTKSQRAYLMSLATRLDWDREARLAYGNEMLGLNVESWNDLSAAQAEKLIATMAELADMVDPQDDPV